MISYVRLLLLLIQLTTITPAASTERMLRGIDDSRELKPRNNNNSTTTHHLEHHQTSHLGGMETRIIGGSQSTNGRHSYTVALLDRIGLFCGASLIAKDMILTAAHCGDNKGDFDIYIGSEKISGGGEFRSFTNSWKHKSFSWDTLESDYMLFKLDSPVTLDVAIVTVNDNDNIPKDAQRLLALGWGDTDPNPGYTGSNDLLKVAVKYIPNGECSSRTGYVGTSFLSYNGQIKGNMLCALDNGRDGCQGDSGGPLVIEGNDSNGRSDLLVGISSWGVACAHKTLPGVYARVSSEYSWIKKIVCENSNDQAQKQVFRCSGGGGGGNAGGGDGNAATPLPTKKPNNKPNNKPKPKPSPNNKPKPKPNSKPAKKKKKKNKKKKKKNQNTSNKKKGTTNNKNKDNIFN